MRGQTEKEYLLVSKTFMCPPFFTRNAFLPVIFVLSKDGHQNFSICFTAKSVPVKWTRTHMYAKFYSSQNNILDLAFGKYFEGINLGYFKGFFLMFASLPNSYFLPSQLQSISEGHPLFFGWSRHGSKYRE